MKGKIVYKYKGWFIEDTENDELIQLHPTTAEYLDRISPTYFRKHIENREFDYLLKQTTLNKLGETVARILTTNRVDTWDDIYLKFEGLPDGEFIDCLKEYYNPPKSKMPF